MGRKIISKSFLNAYLYTELDQAICVCYFVPACSLICRRILIKSVKLLIQFTNKKGSRLSIILVTKHDVRAVH